MRAFSVLLSQLFLIILLLVGSVLAHPPDRIPDRISAPENQIISQDRILFITVTVFENEVRLEKAVSVVGKLKSDRQIKQDRDFFMLLRDASGYLIGKHSLDNPLIKIYEYENPQNEGELLSKVIALDSATVSLRVPHDPEIDVVQFFIIDSESESRTQKFLGSINLRNIELK